MRTADILLNGVEFEIKSPITNKPDKLERNIKRALKQSKNIIIDSSRIKNMRDDTLQRFLIGKVKEQKQIGQLILVTKRGKIVVSKLFRRGWRVFPNVLISQNKAFTC